MAFEAVIVELLGDGGDPVRYTCANGVGIAKGAVMELVSPRTAQAVTAVDTPIVGIAAEEKTASDGVTQISVYTNGIFQLTTGAAETCTIGDTVSVGAVMNNIALASTLDDEKGWTLGYALEDIGNATLGMVRVKK